MNKTIDFIRNIAYNYKCWEVNNMPKSAREILNILKKNGFKKIDQNGSHIKMYNSATKKTTIVPSHSGDVPIGTEKNIWKQAGLK